jgi:hypothetical protein
MEDDLEEPSLKKPGIHFETAGGPQPSEKSPTLLISPDYLKDIRIF